MATAGSNTGVALVIASRPWARPSALAVVLGLGCGGSDESKMTQAWNPDDSGEATAAVESSDGDPSAGTPGQTSDSPMPCDDVCETPPNDRCV